MQTTRANLLLLIVVGVAAGSSASAKDLPRIRVADDRHGFVLAGANEKFTPWGFNYDHDEQGRLIEDYWEKEWPKIEADFREMRELGANVVRVHLQLGKFLSGPIGRTKPT